MDTAVIVAGGIVVGLVLGLGAFAGVLGWYLTRALDKMNGQRIEAEKQRFDPGMIIQQAELMVSTMERVAFNPELAKNARLSAAAIHVTVLEWSVLQIQELIKYTNTRLTELGQQYVDEATGSREDYDRCQGFLSLLVERLDEQQGNLALAAGNLRIVQDEENVL